MILQSMISLIYCRVQVKMIDESANHCAGSNRGTYEYLRFCFAIYITSSTSVMV